jgi:protein ImuA
MPDHSQTLASLRGTLETACRTETRNLSLGHAPADACLRGGLRRGALHEVFPAHAGHEPAAIGFAAALAIRMGLGKKLLWIGQDFSALEFGTLSAAGLLELGLDPSRLLLLRAADAACALRAAGDALTCSSLGAVVAEIPGASKILDLTSSRRLTLAAAAHDVPAILLRPAARPQPSAAETRWLIGAAPSLLENEDCVLFDAELSRNRHGAAGRWVMEWSADDGVFKSFEGAAHSGAVAAAPADGQDPAQERFRRFG